MKIKHSPNLVCNRARIVLCVLALYFGSPEIAHAQNSNPQQKENTAVQEDINEFLGYEDLLLVRYISLPYDTVMTTNIVSYFVDVGFFLILFLPFTFLLGRRIPWYYHIAFILLSLGFLYLSVPSAFINKNKIPVQGASSLVDSETASHPFATDPVTHLAYRLKRPFIRIYENSYDALSAVTGPRDYMTYPILLVLLILSVVLLERRIRHHQLATKTVLFFLLVYSFLWLLLSSGIPWYGLLMFPLVLLFTVRGVLSSGIRKKWDRLTRSGLLLTAAAIWMVMAFAYRFSNYEPKDESRTKLPFLPSVSQYQIGREDQAYVFDRLFPQYRAALNKINQEDQSYIYRVSTLMPFFIRKNDQRVLSDNFLEFFISLEQKFPNHQELAQALKAYGFRYIIVDLNLHANDHTPEGSLKNKFQRFMSFIYQNPQLSLIATDRITRGPDGMPMFQVFPENNPIEHQGWFAVYQII